MMRNYKLDTLKGILIYLVILGHLLELVYKDNTIARTLYIAIYSFHMPLFVFTTGYFAKCNLKKICMHMVYPYVLFSVLFWLCSAYWWKNAKSLSFFTPYWLLWYLLATAIWSLSIPLWEKIKGKRQILFLLCCTVIACLAGYDTRIGRVFSLSRIVVFFPFFVLGNYWRQYEKNHSEKKKTSNAIKKILSMGLFALCMILFISHQKDVRYTWLYEATPYSVSRYHAGIRLFHMITGLFSVFAAMFCLPEKPVKGLSELGKRTMPIYLLHGFIIKCMSHYAVVKYLGIVDKKMTTVILCVLTAVILIIILSSKCVLYVTDFVLSPWHIWMKSKEDQ